MVDDFVLQRQRSVLDKKTGTEWQKEFALGFGWFHAKGKK